MQFDLDVIEEGQWFQFFKSEILPDGNIKYFDPEPDAAEFQFRQAGVDFLDIIREKTQGKKQVEFVSNPKTRKMDRVEYYDQTEEQKKLEREMLWDHIIVNWRNAKDSHGNEIPVNIENKMKFLNITMFTRFLNKCLEIIGEHNKAVEKNS